MVDVLWGGPLPPWPWLPNRKHERTVHDKSRPFACDQCNRTFGEVSGRGEGWQGGTDGHRWPSQWAASAAPAAVTGRERAFVWSHSCPIRSGGRPLLSHLQGRLSHLAACNLLAVRFSFLLLLIPRPPAFEHPHLNHLTQVGNRCVWQKSGGGGGDPRLACGWGAAHCHRGRRGGSTGKAGADVGLFEVAAAVVCECRAWHCWATANLSAFRHACAFSSVLLSTFFSTGGTSSPPVGLRPFCLTFSLVILL